MDQGTGGQGRGDPSAGGGGQERNNSGIGVGAQQRGDPSIGVGGRVTGMNAGEQQRREDARRVDDRKLDDVTAISRLKFRYLRTLDTKSWDEFADTMIPEATATYSEYLQFESRDAFLAFMRNTLGPHVITEHRCDHPEIDIDGDSATGTWYLADTVLIPGHNMLLRGAAFYSDEYVRCDDGRWRISHTGYERTYEVVLSLSDLPSLRLTSSRWGLISREDGVISSVERDPGAPPVRREPEAG
ncbi:nuclear transport factor 2 family protein [Nocardia ninae]|uniref:SnoaL-like domain-containing protein n=2 Tax=Nocardia ninae TaxID=356145 RepID=A0A511MFY2_9NOCA|nr:hypothetical protein NN4_38400 [Nocardia ninae NBRC 108245]